MEGKDGHPWDIIRQMNIPRSASLDRFKDVPFALDQLPAWMEAHPEVGDKGIYLLLVCQDILLVR